MISGILKLSESAGMAEAKATGAGASLVSQESASFDALEDPASIAIVKPQELLWVKKLGEGSYATVEECVLHGQSIAVKRLKPHLAIDKAEVDGFVNEGAVVARLNHPFIVPIVGLGFHITGKSGSTRAPETLFTCQELCSGGSLRSKVLAQMAAYNEVIYTYSDGLRWATQVTCALAYLHGQRPMLIHRDIKLDNILLTDSTADADVKLADFGLVASVSCDVIGGVSHEVTVKTISRDLTAETGSYLNMAPEIMGNVAYNEKVDLFSLGCCIFEIFSKTVSAAAMTVTGAEHELKNIAIKVSNGFRRGIPEHWPPALRDLVNACWEQDPALRPSALEAVARLESPALVFAMEQMDSMEKARLAGCCVLQ